MNGKQVAVCYKRTDGKEFVVKIGRRSLAAAEKQGWCYTTRGKYKRFLKMAAKGKFSTHYQKEGIVSNV